MSRLVNSPPETSLIDGIEFPGLEEDQICPQLRFEGSGVGTTVQRNPGDNNLDWQKSILTAYMKVS